MTPPDDLALASWPLKASAAAHTASDVSELPASALTLDTVPLRIEFVVHRLVYAQGSGEWPQRLEELGFLPGERVTVLMRGWPGGDPIAVRVGHSTYALRRAEAACVHVRPWQGLTRAHAHVMP